MRSFAPMLAVMAVACAPADAEAPQNPPPTLQACDASAIQRHLGAAYTPTLGAEMQRTVGARTTRVIRPGEAVTMDYRTDRLNVELDGAGRIVTLRCG